MNNEKKKVRFNIIDLLIILAVIALIAALFIRFDLIDRIGGTEWEEVTIAYRIEGVRYTTAEAMQIGDVFTWRANDITIGTLQTVETSPYYVTVVKEDGTIERAEDEQRCVIQGTISAKGTRTEQGFMLDGSQFLSAGKILDTQSPHIMVTMTVMGISAAS